MSTATQIAREIFPDASDADLDYIVWNRTGYPSFWGIQDGENVEACFRRQLAEYRDAHASLEHGGSLCELCNRAAVPGQWLCTVHEAELAAAKKALA